MNTVGASSPPALSPVTADCPYRVVDSEYLRACPERGGTATIRTRSTTTSRYRRCPLRPPNTAVTEPPGPHAHQSPSPRPPSSPPRFVVGFRHRLPPAAPPRPPSPSTAAASGLPPSTPVPPRPPVTRPSPVPPGNHRAAARQPTVAARPPAPLGDSRHHLRHRFQNHTAEPPSPPLYPLPRCPAGPLARHRTRSSTSQSRTSSRLPIRIPLSGCSAVPSPMNNDRMSTTGCTVDDDVVPGRLLADALSTGRGARS